MVSIMCNSLTKPSCGVLNIRQKGLVWWSFLPAGLQPGHLPKAIGWALHGFTPFGPVETSGLSGALFLGRPQIRQLELPMPPVQKLSLREQKLIRSKLCFGILYTLYTCIIRNIYIYHIHTYIYYYTTCWSIWIQLQLIFLNDPHCGSRSIRGIKSGASWVRQKRSYLSC